MKILPYERLILRTNLELPQVQKALEERSTNSLISEASEIPEHIVFRGKIQANSFKMVRIGRKTSSSLAPVVRGKFQDAVDEGTDLYITFFPVIIVLIFLLIWTVGLGSLCVWLFIHWVQGNIPGHSAMSMPFLMWALGVGIFTASWQRELKLTKETLLEVFDAQIVDY